MFNIGNLTTSQFIKEIWLIKLKRLQRLLRGCLLKKELIVHLMIRILGPISRLNAQVLSLGEAISNGAEGKILTQTADSGQVQ